MTVHLLKLALVGKFYFDLYNVLLFMNNICSSVDCTSMNQQIKLSSIVSPEIGGV
jgi:hypothetical protein